jgi:hypothetical protein
MKHITLSAPLIIGLALAAAPALARENAAPAAEVRAASMSAAPYAPITSAEVEAAQQAWGNALVAISTEADTRGQAAARQMAEQVLDSAYGYGMGPVLFKPTLTLAPQTFRTTREGALAYFVGGNTAYPNDSGFALKHWRKFQIDNAGIVVTGNSAISMGNVTLWDSKGAMVRVDKTWGYVRGGDGKLRIVLHHSSLPYSPK